MITVKNLWVYKFRLLLICLNENCEIDFYGEINRKDPTGEKVIFSVLFWKNELFLSPQLLSLYEACDDVRWCRQIEDHFSFAVADTDHFRSDLEKDPLILVQK